MNLEWFRKEIANRGAEDGNSALTFKALDKAAQQWTKTGHKTTPDPQKIELYRERLGRYRAYIQAINEVNETQPG